VQNSSGISGPSLRSETAVQTVVTLQPPPMFTAAPWAKQAAPQAGGSTSTRMLPPQTMMPGRGQTTLDQTTAGFVFTPGSWDHYFDRRHDVPVAAGDTATNTALQAYSVGEIEGTDGQAPPVIFVLLHGGGLTSLSWALVASRLGGKGHSVLAHDLRAHGQSAGTESELSIDQLCADTIEVVLALTVGVASGWEQWRHPCA
jgi:hypothetical protein